MTDEDEKTPRRVRLVRRAAPRARRKVLLKRVRGDASQEPEVLDPQDEAGEEGLPLDADAEAGIQRMARALAAQLLPGLVKRIVSTGVEHLTDEALRKLGADVEVPGEIEGVDAENAPRVRREITRLLGKEIRDVVGSNVVSQEIQRLMTSVTFEIKTEIRLRPVEESAPRVRSRVRLKRAERE